MTNSGGDANARWTREQKLALAGALGVPLAIFAILFGDDLIDKWKGNAAEERYSSYVAMSDRTCAKHGPALAALGEDRWQQSGDIYAAQMRKKNAVLQAILNDWQAIPIPHKEEEVKEAQSLAQASIRQYEIAADVMEQGEAESANTYIAEGGRSAKESFAKARSAGFQICPGGR